MYGRNMPAAQSFIRSHIETSDGALPEGDLGSRIGASVLAGETAGPVSLAQERTAVRNLLETRNTPPILSALGDASRPGELLFDAACEYRNLFIGPLMRRSPAAVNRKGLLDGLLARACLGKVILDAEQGHDVSVVLYPLSLSLAAWDLVTDAAGRVYEVSAPDSGPLELSYQGGVCHSRQDWEQKVRHHPRNLRHRVRNFYRRALELADHRIEVAGTVDLGLWEALWMSFDFAAASDMLDRDPEFVQEVFARCKHFLSAAFRGMVEAGIRTVFYREHSAGFPPGLEMMSRLDAFIGDHLRELTMIVRAAGGSVFLDSNADETLETDFPLRWGFDGIGPMMFRDEDDLEAAATVLSEDLLLVGMLRVSSPGERLRASVGAGRVLLAAPPWCMNRLREPEALPSDAEPVGPHPGELCPSA